MKTNKYIKLIHQFFLVSILCLYNYASNAQAINISPIAVTEYCAGNNIIVDYVISGGISGLSNIYTAQLSDGSGSFTSPLNIGQLTSNTSGTILATIPTNTVFGIGYRIRVVGSNPPIIGPDNGLNLRINPIPTANAGPDQVICGNSTASIFGAFGGSASSGSWTSSTNSTFLSNTAATNYFPNLLEIANGFVVLTYTTNDPIGPCAAAKDSLIVGLLAPAYSNAGIDQTICASSNSISLIGTISGPVSSGSWSTLGTGTFTNASSLNTNYILSTADKSSGIVKIILTSSDPVGPCNPVSDTMILIINQLASLDAGLDQTNCGNSNVFLNATKTATNGTLTWSSSGTGTFTNVNTLTTTYIPSLADYISGSVILKITNFDPINSCQNAKDSLLVNLSQLIIANAGVDRTVCASDNSISLTGIVSGSVNTGSWSTLGTGTFTNANSLITNYTFSPTDKTAGIVKLILTSADPAGPCNSVNDTMILTIKPLVTIDAGIDKTICGNSNILLNASTTATSGTISWTTSGTGTFTNGNTLTPSYFPSLADNILGSVKLKITNFDPINLCQNTKDSMILTLNQPTVTNAGVDQTLCTSNNSVFLAGTVSGTVSTGSWRTLGTGTFTNANSLLTNYIFSSNDKTVGLVKLILTSSDPAGPCNPVLDTVIITLRSTATINASMNQTICRNNNIILNASSTAISGVITWTTNGSGIFLNGNTLTPTYVPSLADNILGSVTLTISNFDSNNICQNVIDSMLLTINQLAIADAGSDQTVCSSVGNVSLVGNVSGSVTTGSWRTLGTGSFSNVNSLNTIYTFSPNDKTVGIVKIILKSTDPIGPCNSVNDTMIVTIKPFATINAGPDQIICGSNTVKLVGSIGGSNTSGTWTSSSNPLFLSNDSVVNYIPTNAQINSGSFYITYTSNVSSGLCSIASDSMLVTVNIPPTVNAGNDIYTCSYATSVDIIGTKAGFPTNPLWVTLNGSGSFNDPTSLTTKYIPSAADLAAKSIIISLTTNDPIGPCYAAYDDINVYFKDSTVTFTSVVQNIYCDSMVIKFVNDTNNVGYTYTWDFGDGFFSNIANPIHTYNYTGSINVSLVANGPGGCVENVNNTFNINSVKPRADFVVNNLNQCLNDNNFELNNASQDASAGYINNVKWDFGDNTISTASIPSNKTYYKAGSYNIKLIVATTNGCQDSIVKGVNVLQSPEKPIVTLYDGKILISSSLIANHWYYSNIEIPGATNKYYAISKFGVYKLRVDSTNGCSNFSDDLDLKYTSKAENIPNDKIKIYPNPTKGLFNIECQLEYNYSIYDYSGKEIISGKKEGNTQLIDLSNFKSGIYLIKLFNNQEQFIIKIIKD